MEKQIFYHKAGAAFSADKFAAQLSDFIEEASRNSSKKGLLFLCIGSDRSTGDSLGPLVGHSLSKISDVKVIGTLSAPVHAMNLDRTVKHINEFFNDYTVVAVDASIGRESHIGYITLGKGALKPGLGVSKNLCEVGDIFITGIVGSSQSEEPLVLQSTRLKIVVELAESICEGIERTTKGYMLV